MKHAWTLEHHCDAETSTRGWDAAIADVAERQHGRIARRQLVELGLGRGAIGLRLRRGRLHPEQPGVYAVGHAAPAREGRWMAAVLAAGPDAALSHWSAAALWGLRGGGAHPHVTGPRRKRLKRATVHRALLRPDELTEEEGIPVTTPSRTLLDLAPLLPSPSLARMLEAAEKLPRTPGPTLPELLDRYPRRAGAKKLRALLAQPIARTRSDFEAEFRAWMRGCGLPDPETNALVELGAERIEADFVWRAERVLVELDTFETHGSRSAFERDRRRDRAAQAAGWRTLRVTDLTPDVERDLRKLLAPAAARD